MKIHSQNNKFNQVNPNKNLLQAYHFGTQNKQPFFCLFQYQKEKLTYDEILYIRDIRRIGKHFFKSSVVCMCLEHIKDSNSPKYKIEPRFQTVKVCVGLSSGLSGVSGTVTFVSRSRRLLSLDTSDTRLLT